MTTATGIDAVRRLLDLDDGPGGPRSAWLRTLAATGAPGEPATLPASEEMAGILRRLGVPPADIAPVIATVPHPRRDPELWWALERCVEWIRTRMGTYDDPDPPWPDLPPVLGASGRYFHVHAFLAALPATREFHRAHGVPDDISWATLSDLGDKMRMYRRAHGTGGLDKQDWLTLHLRGSIYALGRLQFAVTPLTPELRLPAAVAPVPPVGLGVHVPATGPLGPAAVDDSFARAPDFFAAHLDVSLAPLAVCTSWLLDPQLAEYLPPDSNIVDFQRRFTLTGAGEDSDADILEFVTGRPDRAVEDVPRGTTLERAIAAHLRAGRHWRLCTGWRPNGVAAPRGGDGGAGGQGRARNTSMTEESSRRPSPARWPSA